MRNILILSAVLGFGTAAQAAVPFLNATCGDGTEVHADQGGPVYINGKQAKLKKYNDNAYDAIVGHITISLTVNPDGSPTVTYTGKGGANGVCKVASSGGSKPAKAKSKGKCPADVSEADRYKYPACN